MPVMVPQRRRSTILSESRLEIVPHLSEVLPGLAQIPAGEILSQRGEILLNGTGSRRRCR